MVKLLGLCFIVLSACFAWEASAQEKQALRRCKRFRCRKSKAVSTTWAWISKRTACLSPPSPTRGCWNATGHQTWS
jgi:hypothetical protein